MIFKLCFLNIYLEQEMLSILTDGILTLIKTGECLF